MSIQIYSVAVTTTGDNASATGSGTINIPRTGHLEWVYLNFHASAPGATTDVTISNADTPPGGNILVTTDTATDAIFYPRATCVSNANSAITNSLTRFAVIGDLTVAVAQSNALTACVTAYAAVSHED